MTIFVTDVQVYDLLGIDADDDNAPRVVLAVDAVNEAFSGLPWSTGTAARLAGDDVPADLELAALVASRSLFALLGGPAGVSADGTVPAPATATAVADVEPITLPYQRAAARFGV